MLNDEICKLHRYIDNKEKKFNEERDNTNIIINGTSNFLKIFIQFTRCKKKL